MWTEITRPQYDRSALRYASDLTDDEWNVVMPFLPPTKELGRPRTTDLREVLNVILYMTRTGRQWPMSPREFPPCSTVHKYFYAWRSDGTFLNFIRSAFPWLRHVFADSGYAGP